MGGAFFQSVVLSFAIITVMASGISAHAGVSRLMYVMGRDGVLPKKFFGYISPKSFTPAYNIWLAGVIGLTAGFLSLEFVVALISFGALTAFSFVNLSVICSYGFRDGRLKNAKDILNYFIVPLLGFISIGALWLEVEDTSLKAGIAWAAVGIVYLAWMTKGFKKPAPQYQHNEHDED